MRQDVGSDPSPTMLRVVVVAGPHPAASVLLPDSSGAMPTIVIAGAVPVPAYERLTLTWLVLAMLNPVTVTSSTRLMATKLDEALCLPQNRPGYPPGV